MTPYHAILRQHLQPLHFREEIVEDILSCFTVKHYQKQSHFACIGDMADKLGYVVSGMLYLYLVTEDGDLFVKDFVVPDQFVLATFEPEKESIVSVRVLHESVLLEAKYSAIQRLFAYDPHLAASAKRNLETRLQTIYRRMESFAMMDSDARYRQFQREYDARETMIPQYLIASYLGITPTQLSRIRKKK